MAQGLYQTSRASVSGMEEGGAPHGTGSGRPPARPPSASSTRLARAVCGGLRRGLRPFGAALRWPLAQAGKGPRQGPSARAATFPGVPRIQSLKVKLTLCAGVVAAAILLLTYGTLSSSARRVAAEQAQEHVEEVLSYFSGIFAEAVAAGDRMQVHLLARALLDNGVQALCVTDKAGDVIYSSRPVEGQRVALPALDAKPFKSGLLGTITVDGKAHLQAASTVRFGSAPVGMLHLLLNSTDLEGRMQKATAFTYPVLAVGFILMLGLCAVTLRMPFRALKRLTEAAESIGAGDLSSRVPVSGRDEVAAFCAAFNKMVDSLSSAREEILIRNIETIRAMVSAVEAKDSYTQGHCVRVRGYVGKILDGFPRIASEERERILTAALLHDIGKIGIPDDLLLKEHRLGKNQMEVVREHVIIGERILLHCESMKEAARWVRHHHERWDGLGYPDGLRGEAIPFASRVIGVADCIDAMLTDRPYRDALVPSKVVKALEEEKGKQFDPQVAERAIAFLSLEPDKKQEKKAFGDVPA